MIESGEQPRDLAVLVVAQRGALKATGELFEPYRLLDASGRVVGPVAAYLRELQACGRSATTQRSYGMVLLRWFRFLWAIGVSWDQATRVEACDFSRWVQVAGKPVWPHWRRRGEQVPGVGSVPVRTASTPNPVTGKAPPGLWYASTTVAHGETVLRSFYEFHLDNGSGPMVNPFPLSRDRRRSGRGHAHHNPMEPFDNERGGLYRPKVLQRVLRQIPDEQFNALFAALGSHRDRALVALWVSSGARAAELLGVTCGDIDPGQQLVTVIRKGSRALQQLPASWDAFVWLRLYQQQMQDLVPSGRDQPLWWTPRRPFHQLTYHAAYRMFARVNAELGTNWSLHDLRHTAAYRMARDPQMPLTDVQWVLGHAQLSTTGLYLSPLPEDVIASVVAFHERRGAQQPPTASPSPGYRPESLNILVREGPVMAPGVHHSAGPSIGSAELAARAGAAHQAEALRGRFPPPPVADTWSRTRLSRTAVLARLATAPFVMDTPAGEDNRMRGIGIVLDWLEAQPGETWQQRWLASGAGRNGRGDWRAFPTRWRKATTSGECRFDTMVLGTGLLSLMCADVIRPGIAWLLTTTTPKRLATEMARTRDPAGYADLTTRCEANPLGESTTRVAMHRIAAILAAKGGVVADITIGDCLQLLDIAADVCNLSQHKSPYFYQWLHSLGVFNASAAPTVRALSAHRQLSVEQLIDRCDIECRPVRDLLVDYLRERQVSIDHVTLVHLADALGRLFWRDLELHHPGIDSLRLASSVAAGWKQRIATKTTRRKQADGSVIEVHSPRHSATNCLTVIRAFYLDIAHWATDDPARWGPWAVPCPIKAGEIPHRKQAARRKSRRDQRTRERIPVLPALIAAVDRERSASAQRLTLAQATRPGEVFTAAGQTLRRTLTTRAPASIWAEDPTGGPRRNLTREEHRAFWAWAAVEVLRHTGVRIEELTELTHPSLVQYRLPTTGDLVPLLHIVASKTDTERLLVISPELADVLSAIICRVRDDHGALPLVAAYDYHERVFNPPLPILFQRRVGTENRAISAPAIRTLLDTALATTGMTEPDGQPMRFVPHDFRRIFITDAVMNGIPPHIAQLVVGHRDINTTMGYKAVYPEEAINGHRAFITRRRELRPSEEYRTPTEQEWEEFLGHFEHRKLALGSCGRAFGTNCIHEHSCIRCPLLRPDPTQRHRLAEIRDNLTARVEEAQRERWLGEVKGLKISLAAANQKLAQLDDLATHRTTIHLGIPTFPDIAGRTLTTPLTTHDRDHL